jgi:hypothetical protein
MSREIRTIFDPFTQKTVEIRNELVLRLRGKYAIGPTLPNGEPEFGWQQMETPPIQHEAAAEIERLQTEITMLELELNEAVRRMEATDGLGSRRG